MAFVPTERKGMIEVEQLLGMHPGSITIRTTIDFISHMGD